MKTKAQINIFDEIIVDNFAGGGGASTGIELATGRPVTIAINHDPDAILMHETNHPYTEHYCESVWAVDPRKACRGRRVGLAWFSPDCKHFSKAKGGKPVDKNIRGLAWVVLRWAALTRPRVIILENVEEFQTWGPVRRGRPVRSKSGATFLRWKCQLEALGYVVETNVLRACDYGAPTIRKRFFAIARCDGQPINWPTPSHGDPAGADVKSGCLKPWRTAAEIIDWSLPCPSIFERNKPLAENTLRRIARGIEKFVINNPDPFIVTVNHAGDNFRGQSINEPLKTTTARNGYGIVMPIITSIGQTGTINRSSEMREPLRTIVSKAEHCLISPTLLQYHGEKSPGEVRGQSVNRPILTVDSNPRYALVSAFVTKFYKTGIGQDMREPLHTVTTSPGHFGEVRAFLIKYYGQDIGQTVGQPLGTVVSKDRFGLVLVHGEPYQIVDIGLRMLTSQELYAAQGFPPDYIIAHDYTGKAYPKSKQVARCGNAVPPPFAEALVRANLPELCGNKTETMKQLKELVAI